MAKCIMIQGTMSNVGKSLLTAGLCRIFKRHGYKVAPFKSQNMALNSFITEDGLEMGRAQVVQAEACSVKADVRMNPVLLKPTSDSGSQVIVMGEVIGNMRAAEYYEFKNTLKPIVQKAFDELMAENDIIVIEGAGSPAEINLKQHDIVNMGMAKMANSPVLLVGDIDRGGVFASLYGTYLLQDEDEKKYIKGTIINKFRGDVNILKPGVDMLENLIKLPNLGVVPYTFLDIEDEDSLSDRFTTCGTGDIDIAIIRLPKISNFTDFNALSYMNNVKVRYVNSVSELRDPDMIILPGTKNTLGDLKWLRQSGLESEILKFADKGKTIFGICGGYQMLCQTLSDPHNVEEGGEMRGLGLIAGTTIFEKEKVRTRVTGKFREFEGNLKYLSNAIFEGYEIHMGKTTGDFQSFTIIKTDDSTLTDDGGYTKNVYGSYVHGIFDSGDVLTGLLKSLYELKGLEYNEQSTFDIYAHKEREYNKLADVLEESLDMDAIYKILNEGV